MKIRKIQSELFQMLQQDKKVSKVKISENEYAFTDGRKAFILPVTSINFNMERCQEIKTNTAFDTFKENKNDVELEFTRDVKDLGFKVNKQMIRILKAKCKKSFDVWINNSWFNYFENPKFYGYNENNRVLVKETICGKEKLVAVLMPVRHDNYEED